MISSSSIRPSPLRSAQWLPATFIVWSPPQAPLRVNVVDVAYDLSGEGCSCLENCRRGNPDGVRDGRLFVARRNQPFYLFGICLPRDCRGHGADQPPSCRQPLLQDSPADAVFEPLIFTCTGMTSPGAPEEGSFLSAMGTSTALREKKTPPATSNSIRSNDQREQ